MLTPSAACFLYLGFESIIGQQREQIFFDELSTNENNWDHNGDVVIPSYSTQCLYESNCFELRNGWVERSFSTKGYKDVQIVFFLHGDTSGTLSIYVYDSFTIITSLLQQFDTDDQNIMLVPPTISDWDNIELFKVRFQIFGSPTAFLDTFSIWGTTFTFSPSSSPTFMPTQNPSAAATENTLVPTCNPTSQPTMNPSFDHARRPTNIPTVSASENEGNVDETDEIETTNNENGNDKASDSIFSDQNILENQYYLYIVAAVFLCFICAIIICWFGFTRMKRAEGNDNIEHENVKSSSSHTNMNENIEMLPVSSIETQTPTGPVLPVHQTMNSVNSIDLNKMIHIASIVGNQMMNEGNAEQEQYEEEEDEDEDDEEFYAMPNQTKKPDDTTTKE